MTQEMIRYYASRAAEYDRVYELSHWQPALAHLRGLVSQSFRGRRVFEVACGTGYWTAQVAAVARHVRGTDINEETLAVARARVAGAANVDLAHADAYAPPADYETFDAGLAALWLSHVATARMEEFLHAFHARLEPGGVVVMFDERNDPARSARTTRTDGTGDRYERRRLKSGEEFEIIKNFFDRERLAALLASYAADLVFEDFGRFWAVTYRRSSSGAPLQPHQTQ